MPKTKPPYPAEFRRQMVELAQAGENAAAYLGKGSHVNVVGRLKNNNYRNGEGVEIDRNVGLNRALWVLAEEMRRLKQ